MLLMCCLSLLWNTDGVLGLPIILQSLGKGIVMWGYFIKIHYISINDLIYANCTKINKNYTTLNRNFHACLHCWEFDMSLVYLKYL
jgi:hypothetical protein